MTEEQFARVIVAVQLAAFAVLLVRVVSQGLAKGYWLFLAYLAAQFIQSAIFLTFNLSIQDGSYQYVFMASESVNLVLATLIVLELYTLVLKDYEGLAAISKRYFRFALIASLAISLVLVFAEHVAPGPVAVFLIFERALNMSLLVFIGLIAGFLLYYPVPLRRNVIVFTIGYSAFFLCKAAVFFILTTLMAEAWRPVLNNIPLFVSIGCMAYWVVFLTRAGETEIKTARPQLTPERQRQAMDHVKAINEILLKSRKEMAPLK
jgi:hypothetical protein